MATKLRPQDGCRCGSSTPAIKGRLRCPDKGLGEVFVLNVPDRSVIVEFRYRLWPQTVGVDLKLLTFTRMGRRFNRSER